MSNNRVNVGTVSIEPVSIRLDNVSKSFGGQTVVHPFSLDIAASQKVAILGPSGCGKTTTLRLIAGLESPAPGGRVILGDQDVTGVPVEKRGIGMVFQHFALFPHMSGGERGLRPQGQEKAQGRAPEYSFQHAGAGQTF